MSENEKTCCSCECKTAEDCKKNDCDCCRDNCCC